MEKYNSHYRGIVHDNNDPENMGRIKVKIPSIYGDDYHDYWAYPVGLLGYWMPENGDLVWITFENGDPRYPLWQHGGWLKGKSPTDSSSTVKVLQTDSGTITFNNDDGSFIISNGDNTITMNKDGITLKSANLIVGSSDESAILGDTTVSLLKEFLDDIGAIGAITVPSGVSGTINTSPQWSIIVNKWSSKWDKIKSNSVKVKK